MFVKRNMNVSIVIIQSVHRHRARMSHMKLYHVPYRWQLVAIADIVCGSEEDLLLLDDSNEAVGTLDV